MSEVKNIINTMSITEVVARLPLIEKYDLPQIKFEVEIDNDSGFINVRQGGTRKMWFYLCADKSKKTDLNLVIAMQDPDDEYVINSHHFIKVATMDDMIELINYKLNLNHRI